MSWIEQKYISLCSNRLLLFKKLSSTTWTFRCPFCNDSEKSKSKKRGYIYEKKGHFSFFCHNCGRSSPFKSFLHDIDPILYSDFLKEKYVCSPDQKQIVEIDIHKSITSNIFDDLPKITSLMPSHPARKYLENRKIPKQFLHQLYFCDHFHEFVNLHEQKFASDIHEEKRIIIPMLNVDKNVIGFQGRILGGSANTLRYITTMLDNSLPRMYGLDRLNFNKRVYCVEGPFDSMFLDNAVATCGGRLISEVEKARIPFSNVVIIYDNEPRNRQVCHSIETAISDGYSVVIWPDHIKQKDVNDMVLAGIDVTSLIAANITSGLEASLRCKLWKKC